MSWHECPTARAAQVLDSVEAVDPNQMAAGDVDETSLNRLVVAVSKVAENYGIRFPREFALLVKQASAALTSLRDPARPARSPLALTSCSA